MHCSSLVCKLVPGLLCPLASIIVAMLVTNGASAADQDCHGQVCQPFTEFCSAFVEGCVKCSSICDHTTHNYQPENCLRYCPAYSKYDAFQTDIHVIQTQQRICLILLAVLLAFIVIRYAYKSMRWMRQKRCITLLLKKLQPKKKYGTGSMMGNGKDLADGATTIQNVMTINETERGTSQIYSLTGAEGSVMTMTTPISTRYPAENSTTPTTIAEEHSYDNQALAVTPVSEKPRGVQVF